jgi:hypothetical protein
MAGSSFFFGRSGISTVDGGWTQLGYAGYQPEGFDASNVGLLPLADSSITIRGAASAQQDSGTSITVNVSTIDGGAEPSVGDLLLAVCTVDGESATQNEHIRIKSNEGKWHRVNNAHNLCRSAFFYKFRESGDDNTIAFQSQADSDEQMIAGIVCVRGVDTTQPIARYSQHIETDDVPNCLAETTPVAGCVALAWYTMDSISWGTETPTAGWTERLDLQTNDTQMYLQSRVFDLAGTSTGTAALSDQGLGTNAIVGRMIVLQPPQALNAKDVRCKAGSFQSATGTGNQDITGLGFDCKALILWYPAAAATVSADIQYNRGIGADDGVTAVQQRYVGIWHDNLTVNEAGYSGIGEILKHYIATNSTLASPDAACVYSKITDGFRLNWSVVEGTARRIHYIAFGGADFRATVGSEQGSTSPVSGLPWRPHAAHILSQCVDSNVDQIRTTAAIMSFGWQDFQSGGAWYAALNAGDGSQPMFLVRDSGFCGQVDAGTLTYELAYEQTNSDGWSWVGSNTDYFFYLAMNFDGGGTGTTFPFFVEFTEGDNSGTAGEDQTLPVFNAGRPKQVIHIAMGRVNQTDVEGVASTFSEGFVNSDLAQDLLAIGKSNSDSEKKMEINSAVLSGSGGDLDTITKRGAFTSMNVIDWAVNSVSHHLLGLFTMGQGLDPNLQKPIFFGCNF